MSSVASLTVNDVTMDWDDNKRRKKLPCWKCGVPTSGRAFWGKQETRETGKEVSCLDHAMTLAFSKAKPFITVTVKGK